MKPRQNEDPAITVRRAAMNLLARREQSFFELRKKLTEKFPELDLKEIIQPVLQRIREENLQSDGRFIESYIRYRLTRGVGPLKIEMELQQKGVSGPAVRKELYAEEVDWAEICREVMTKKFGESGSVSIAEKEKRYRFLSQRGFENEQIRTALKN